MYDDAHLTWAQRRELDLELWLGEHLDALADVQHEELDDPDALRALGTRAQALADVIGALRAMRGDRVGVERLVADFRAQLDELG